MRLFERLNKAAIVALVFAAFLIADGFLLHRYATIHPSSASTPASVRQDTTVASSIAAVPGTSAATSTDSGFSPSEAPTLQEALQECKGDKERCVRQFVEKTAPKAEYAGGRIDADTGDSDRNRSILFFVDPTMKRCEYERLEYSATDATMSYAVIITAETSFDSEGGSDCAPEL